MMLSSDSLSANMCFLHHIRLQPHVSVGNLILCFTGNTWSVSHVTTSDCSYGHWDYTAGYNSPDIPKMLEGKDKDRHKPAVVLKFLVEMFLLKSFKISNAQSRSRPSIPISHTHRFVRYVLQTRAPSFPALAYTRCLIQKAVVSFVPVLAAISPARVPG